jgi:CSLREA domain-containing protein
MKALRLLPVLLLSFLFIGGFPVVIQVSGAPTSEIVVDTLEDEINDKSDCSLREAITAANDNTSVDACPAGQPDVLDKITFAISGAIRLTEPLTVTSGGPLELDGGEAITVSGDNHVRVFVVEEDANLALRNLSISNGFIEYEYGGGIINYGAITITNSILYSNTALIGGGVSNEGTLWITNSTIFSNTAIESGGGIYNRSTLTISDSKICSNTSSYVGYGGGGIRNDGIVNISDSNIYQNNSVGEGGGISNKGTLIISSNYISHNNAEKGGGIGNRGLVTITRSTIAGNHAAGSDAPSPNGGGIWNQTYGNVDEMGTMFISGSTISGNIVDVTNAFEGSGEGGGGIYNCWDCRMTIHNSTFSSNEAISEDYNTPMGGGIYNSGALTITNSTFSANSAEEGGGIFDGTNVTTVFASNTIFAYSVIGGNCGGDPITDGGHNLDDGITCGLSTGSLTNPLLGPLQDNGGPTLTHAQLPGSPAIDNANPQHCTDIDQRGAPRPFDGDDDGESICDIGAVEFIPGGFPFPTTTTIDSDEPDPSQVNQPFTVTFSVTSTYEVPTGIVSVIVSDSPESCYDVLTEGSSSCQLTITNTGTYTLTANYKGNATYSPSSDNEFHLVSTAETKLLLPRVLNNSEP